MPPTYGAAPAFSTSSSSGSSASSDDEEGEHEVAPPSNPKPKPIAAAPSSSDEDESSSGEEVAASPSNPKPKPKPKPIVAAPSSSDEDESSSGEEEVAPPSNSKPKPIVAAPSSSDEDESSGSEEEVAPPPPKPKPTTAAKPASSSDEDESSSSDDDAPPASEPAPAVPAPSATPAQPLPAPPAAMKSKAFQRTWTDADEIALLQGVLLYNASNGVLVSSNSDMKQFRQFIQGSLQIEVKPSQLFDRVRRFKAKYQKARDKGKSPSSAKPHDATVYELSRKIWGTERLKTENGNTKESRAAKWHNGNAKESRAAKRHKGHEISNGAEEKNGDTDVAQVQVQVRYPYLAEALSRMGASIGSGFLLNEVIGMVDASEAMALDQRHKKLVMMQVDLINDTAALIKKATENMC